MLTVLTHIVALSGVLCALPQENLYVIISLCIKPLRIFDRYADALKGLDGFSHVWVFYWLDKNDTPRKRSTLQVHPRGNKKNPLVCKVGIFACRAPVRPNLIALSLCKILSVKGGVVHIEKIDAFDNSPVLDLKPYAPGIDSPTKGVRLPDWVKR